MIDHDRLFKELLTTFFADFIELFIPHMASYLDFSSLVFLEKEIFTDVTAGDVHEADLVVKAKFKDKDSFFLVHTETQAQPQAEFGMRLFRYFARLHEKYALPVYPVALFSFDRPKFVYSSVYEIGFPDLDVLRFQYAVIQLNQLDWRQFLGLKNPVAVALMVKMQIAPKDRPHVKLECLRMLSTLKLDRARVRMISGFIDTYLRLTAAEMKLYTAEIDTLDKQQREEVMEIVTSWMEEGIKQGLHKGREEGRAFGRQEEAISLVSRQLIKRLGPLQPDLLAPVQKLSLQNLEKLSEVLLDFKSPAEFKQWLEDHDSNLHQ